MRRAVQRYISRKKDLRRHEPAAEQGREPGDKAHAEGCGTHCPLHLSLYWEDLPSEIRGPPDHCESLVQGCPAGGGGSREGTCKQIRHIQVHGTWWDTHTSAEETVWCHCKATLKYLWKVPVIRGGSWKLEENKCHSCLQEVGSRELQAGQPPLCPWESNGRKTGDHLKTYDGQKGD